MIDRLYGKWCTPIPIPDPITNTFWGNAWYVNLLSFSDYVNRMHRGMIYLRKNNRAVMCRHIAATLYATGIRLDETPELLFALRSVDPETLAMPSKASKKLVAVSRITGQGLVKTKRARKSG